MDSVNKSSGADNADNSADAASFGAEDHLITAEARIRDLQDMLCSVLGTNKPLTNVHRVALDGHKQICLPDNNTAEPGRTNGPSCSYTEAFRGLPFNVELAERYGAGLGSERLQDQFPGVPFDNGSPTSADVVTKCEYSHNVRSMLPKREIMSFNGDPMKFWLFMRSFETNITSCVQNSTSRLAYLIRYCQGKSREAIESCAILEPEEGFGDAIETLKARFGHPFPIARTHTNSLVNGPTVKPNDFEDLSKLVCEMKACLNTLRQPKYEADLNASVTLSARVRCLPRPLQFE